MNRVLACLSGDDSILALSQTLTAVSQHAPYATLTNVHHVALHKTAVLALNFTVDSHLNYEALCNVLASVAAQHALHLDTHFRPSTSLDSASPPAVFHTLTVLCGAAVSPMTLADVSELLLRHGLTVYDIAHLSGEEDPLRCLELQVGCDPDASIESDEEQNLDVNALRQELTRFCSDFNLKSKHPLDLVLQESDAHRHRKRLVVFDMDGTLIQQEVIDELAKHAGVYKQVEAITSAAMNGQLDFHTSLAQRCSLMRGTPVSMFDAVVANLDYTTGIHPLCRAFKALGARMAVISGGFVNVTKHVKTELGLDYHYANSLETAADGLLTGRTKGPVVTARRKADLLKTIAQREGIAPRQVVAVGDGANDIPMLNLASVGVAFNAKPSVQKQTDLHLNQPDIMNILYILGLSQQQQNELLTGFYAEEDGLHHRQASIIRSNDSVSSFC